MFTTMGSLNQHFGTLSIFDGTKSRRPRKPKNRRGVSVRVQNPQDHNSLLQLSIKEKENFKSYRTAGNLIFAEICEILQAHCETFKISRKIIAGSVGKRISLGLASQPDFDVVIFVNNKLPPLEPVAEEFYKILKKFAPEQHPQKIWTTFNKNEMKVKSYFVTLSFDTTIIVEEKEVKVTISFDVQPASNLLRKNNSPIANKNIAKNQTKAALKLISSLPDPFNCWRPYSSSMGERTVQFTNNHREFVHDFVRLVKLWDGKIEIEDQWKIKGRSILMEMMAIKATYQSKSNAGLSFRKFLNMIIDFENLRIVFHYFIGQPIQIIGQHKTPMVLDPTNPYDNLALGLCPEAIEILRKRAIETLSAWNDRTLISETKVGHFFAVSELMDKEDQ